MTGSNEEHLRELGLMKALELDEKRIGSMTLADLVKLLGDALKQERRRTDERLDHMQRQLKLLQIYERGRRNRELVQATERDDDD
jgi:hypothetical protein